MEDLKEKVEIENKKIDSISKLIDTYYKQAFILIAIGGGSFFYSIKFINDDKIGFSILFLTASIFFGFWLAVNFTKISKFRNEIENLIKQMESDK